jgi:hypothetical protein
MTKTIQNVTTVVPVLITSCQVSEKWKSGPLAAHTTTIATDRANAEGFPAACDTHRANARNPESVFVAFRSTVITVVEKRGDGLASRGQYPVACWVDESGSAGCSRSAVVEMAPGRAWSGQCEGTLARPEGFLGRNSPRQFALSEDACRDDADGRGGSSSRLDTSQHNVDAESECAEQGEDACANGKETHVPRQIGHPDCPPTSFQCKRGARGPPRRQGQLVASARPSV